MRGWRLDRYVERKRYVVFCRKVIRRRNRIKKNRREKSRFTLGNEESQYASLANAKGFQKPKSI